VANDPSDPFASERAKCLEVSNRYRALAGVRPLVQAARAEQVCADEQAKQEFHLPSSNPRFPGQPHGKLYMCREQRQNHADGDNQYYVENPSCSGVCANLNYIEHAIGAWYSDDAGSQWAHKAQMTDPNMTKIACGFYVTNGYIWLNVDYY
jgi:hypothetical protein